MCPTKTQISLGIRPVWSESSLSAWWKVGSLATHKVHSEDSGQPGQMPRLIWVFAGCTDHFVGFVVQWLNYSTVKAHCSIFMINTAFFGEFLFFCSEINLLLISSLLILSCPTDVAQAVLLRCILALFSSWSESKGTVMSPVRRKPVFGVWDQVRLKQICSATATS